MSNKTSSEILLEAANLLEEEKEATWGKGRYFQSPSDADKPCIMCAHGAIAYCGNNEVKKHIMNKAYYDGAVAAPEAAAADATTWADYYTKLAAQENLSLEQYILKHFGETGLAHYKAAKAGLTFNFNDNVAKSKQDVINKLREAAIL